MASPRIPLPKQVEKVHRSDADYDRRREQRVCLDEIYAVEANQPDPQYMKKLKRLQAKALRNTHSERKNGN